MSMQFPSQIFKSDQRGCEETSAYKCLSTFNFKKYQNEYRESFGQLKFLNDESLSPNHSITYTHEEDVQIILLPILGALNYSDSIFKDELIRSEQIRFFEKRKGCSYVFNNPYENEWVNYLHIGFKKNHSLPKQRSLVHDIEFDKLNTLFPLGFNKIVHNQSAGHIGIYQSGSKENYVLTKTENGVFIYVINGAVDVEGRLLERRDGLSLWETRKIEFEALTDNAIVILLEIDLKNINNN